MRIFLTAFVALTIVFMSSGLLAAPPPIPANYQISTPSSQLQNEEQVWVCPTDSTIVIADWRDFRLGYRQIGIGRSTDGGNLWMDSLLSPAMQVFDLQSDPTLTVDAAGNFYLCVLDYKSTGVNDSSFVSFLKSTDKGVSWTGPVTVEHAVGPYFEDKQFITVDRTGGPHNGNVYVSWARFPNPTRIMFSRSINGAASFQDTVIVGPNFTFNNICGSGTYDAGQFAIPYVGADGSVYVSWIGLDVDTTTCSFYSALRVVKSTDGGVIWSAPSVIRHTFGNWGAVDGGVNVYNEPIAATDITTGPFRGNLYITYANQDTSNHAFLDYNIEFIRSSDGGATWTEPMYINDDYTGPGALYDQFHPWLFINEDGVLITIFYDQRTDPVNHYEFDVFAAYSFDGGASFTTNHRISEVSINPGYLLKEAGSNQPFVSGGVGPVVPLNPMAGLIAEYIGVTAFHDHVNAVWTDTRNGNQDVFGANWNIPLLDPRLRTPKNGDTVLTQYPLFTWATDWKQNDDRYRFELSTNPLLGPGRFEYVTDTTRLDSVMGSLAQGNYYWRVKAFKKSTGDSSGYSAVEHFTVKTFVCGDANASGAVNVLDVTYIINFLYKGGAAPQPYISGDVNSSGIVNILDVTYLINFLYKSGPAPNCP